jgi:hypothetical protein
LDLIGLLISSIDHIMTVWINGSIFIMNVAEEGLRVPLQDAGLKGVPQTIAVAMVPCLTLIASAKILRGFIRGVVVVMLVMFVGHALWPLVSQVPQMIRGNIDVA